MNYILSAIASSRSKRRIYALINSVVSKISPEDEKERNELPISPVVLNECVEVAESDKVNSLFLAFFDFLRPSSPVKAYGALKLLEYFVQRCNRNFHVALANCTRLHEKILNLAIFRVTEKSDNWDYSKKKDEDFLLSKHSRQAQRLARLTILEYSRLFVGDSLLEPLAALAKTFESRTKRNLFRAINIQERRVGFRKIKPSDVILIASDGCYPSMQGMHSLFSSLPLTNSGEEPLGRQTTTYDGLPTATSASSCSASEEWVARPGMPYKTLDAFFSSSPDLKRATHEDTLLKDAHQKNHSRDSSFPFASSASSRSCPLWTSETIAGTTIPTTMGHLPLPMSMTKPQRWRCVACQQENSPMAMRCASCETSRYNDEEEEEEAMEEGKKDLSEAEVNEKHENSTIALVESEDLEEEEEEVKKNVWEMKANTSESEEDKDEKKEEGDEGVKEEEKEDEERELRWSRWNELEEK